MFTGIVQAKCDIKRVTGDDQLSTLALDLPESLRQNVELGASIAINGVCLTVKTYDQQTGRVDFDAMQQTLKLTNIGQMKEGDWANVERSATFNKEIGGHVVSGHIDGLATVEDVVNTPENRTIYFSYPAKYDPYLFDKGFVGLNGCSLTIAEIDHAKHQLAVCYIPETLNRTNHGLLEKGDQVNLEIDRQTQAIVDSVERVLKAKGITS